MAIFIVFYLLNIIIWQGFWVFNNYTFIVTAIMMVIYSGLGILQQVRSNMEQSIFKTPLFWISASCLIFFSGFATFFGVYFYYKTSTKALLEMQKLYHSLREWLISLHYIMLTIAVILAAQKVKDDPSYNH